ncbi:putative HEPN_RiboL-PSP domain-containing protein [Nitrospira tepida]|uniref:HEPN_RiboL-PSP domain-containing protein n=2 Tax=Nitrospira tepida TaxID=2973512 RepID=A0AA86MZE9_9BACT|nr:putative HEPN_RiboL-PSP domain-containing protein [Nitrospira tepida]
MSHRFPELNLRRTGRQGDPIARFTIHQFLSQHYINLFTKLEEYLTSEGEQYWADIQKLSRRSAREDLNSWAFATLYPNTVRYAIFISLYNQFEFAMNEACTELEKDYPNDVKLSDLKDKGINRAYTYIKKVVGIPQPFEAASWKKLKDLNALRNLIVHNDSNITDKNRQVEAIKAIERISAWAPVTMQETKVVLSKDFMERVNRFLYEQVQYIGEKLQAAGWE